MNNGLSMILAGILLFNSCSTGKKTREYITKIDSLSAVFEIDAAIYQYIDTNLVISNLQHMGLQLKILDSLAKDDSIPTAVAYRYVRQSYKLFLVENPFILKEIEFSKKQLTNLKFDVENELIEKSEVLLFINQESKALNELQYKMELFEKKINSQLKNYELLNPRIEYLIDSLSKN